MLILGVAAGLTGGVFTFLLKQAKQAAAKWLPNPILWDSAFSGAGAGGYIHIGDGSTVKGCCFMDTGFEEAVFGKECIFEGFGTFSGSKIKKITLGEGITELPSTFASFCDNLEQVDMPESLTKIPDDCFSASPKMEKEQ